MNWSDLLAAGALYLVLEGILPFLSPSAMKRVLASFASCSEQQLRLGGLASMLGGMLLLYLVRS
jgi:uncharacterized protein